VLRECFERALESIDVARLVRDALPRAGDRARGVRVVAIGKAAPAMLKGALSCWPRAIERALAIVPDTTPTYEGDWRVTMLHASHPLPDLRSVEAARRAFEFVRGAARVLALVSGGASALACAPHRTAVSRHARLVRALLLSEATIIEANTVRRHADNFKGGGLALAAAPARVETLLVSDVIGGAPHDIGSGPTLPDPTTRADARAILRARTPRFARVPLRETLGPTDAASRRLSYRIVASPDDLASALARALRSRGVWVRVLAPSVRDVDSIAAEYAALAAALLPGTAVVRAAEPALRVDARRPGCGGRSTHLAALVAPSLPPNVAFLAGASDGVDGTSGTAGAIVDRTFVNRAGRDALSHALATFDTALLHTRARTAIDLGPTGLNLADVHALLHAGR
jgi:hydroxypyruvate reductase